MRRALFLLAPITVCLPGCASTFTAVTDRTITSDRLNRPHDSNKIKSMSGDRRIVRVKNLDMKGGNWLICAEPFAGAIAARNAKSELSIDKQGNGKDEYAAALTKVDEREQVVRLYQDAADRWCNLRAANEIEKKEFVEKLTELQKLAFAALTNAAITDAPKDGKNEGEESKKDDKAASTTSKTSVTPRTSAQKP